MYKDIMFGVGQVIYIMIKVYFLLTQEIQTVPDAQIPSYLSCANIEKRGLFCITKEWSNTSDTIFCFYVLTTEFFLKVYVILVRCVMIVVSFTLNFSYPDSI